jgi:hypothetical protein
VDVDHLWRLARRAEGMADQAHHLGGQVARVATDRGLRWVSPAATEFRRRLVTEARDVRRVGTVLDDAARLLRVHAGAVTSARAAVEGFGQVAGVVLRLGGHGPW